MSTTSTTYQLFTAGHNMTGYLPESDTPVFTSWSDAKQYLINEMVYVSDSIDPDQPDPWGETYAEGLRSSAEDLNLSSGPDWSDIIDAGGRASASWWINVETFTDRDAVLEYVSDLASLDQDDVDSIMVDVDDVFGYHDPECTSCEHDCPWKGHHWGSVYCSVCDDHNEASDDDDVETISPCAYPSTNHSDDVVEVFHGSTTPTVLCGYHSTWNLNDVLRAVRA